MNIIDELLSSFCPIALAGTESVKLMNRTDTKFVFSVQQLPLLLQRVISSHDVLEVNGLRKQPYESVYYDTPDKLCYLEHHNKRLNRFKVRHRTYVDSGKTYFEIKVKSNKGRTRKERIKAVEDRVFSGELEAALLAKETGLQFCNIHPVIRIRFNRITLVDHTKTARITIDTDLACLNTTGEATFPWLAIAEVKQDRNQPSAFRDALAREHIHEFRISKYCLCMASLDKNLRRNNFKQKFHYIHKLKNYDPPTDHFAPVAFSSFVSCESSHPPAGRSGNLPL